MKSLWEPTKQTEAYWRGVIREESRTWEEDGGADKFDSDKDCWLIGGDAYQFTGSETFTIPGGQGEWLTATHHEEPMTLPESVESSAEQLNSAPLWDNDVSDANEDAWAKKRVSEWNRRAELKGCAGQWVFGEGFDRERTRLGNWYRKPNYKVAAPLPDLWVTLGWSNPIFPPQFTYPEDAGWTEKEPKPKRGFPEWPRLLAQFYDHIPHPQPYKPPTFKPTKWHAPTPKPAGWRPFIPKDPHATHGGKLRIEALVCTCVSDPVPMPWRNPDKKVAEWAVLTDGDGPPTFLTSYLRRLLFMNDYVATDPYRAKPMFSYAESDEHTRRLRLTASCGWRYAKSIECIDHRIMHKLEMAESATWVRLDAGRGLHCAVENVDADFQNYQPTSTGEEDIPIRGVPFVLAHWQNHRNYGITFRPSIDLRWEIRRRDRHFWPIEMKVPGYKLHDSAAAIMAHLGCSRATAFRKIKAGFELSECQCDKCVFQLCSAVRLPE